MLVVDLDWDEVSVLVTKVVGNKVEATESDMLKAFAKQTSSFQKLDGGATVCIPTWTDSGAAA